MDTEALRRLHYAAAIACGVFAALVMHIVLTVFGVGLDTVLRGAAGSRQQLISALAWWAIAAAGFLGGWATGAYLNDEMLSNVAKHNVTRFPYEIARLAQDLAGGLMVTMPSEKDLQNNEVGPLIRKFLQGRDGVDVTDRMRVLRLIENMTIGRNAVGYLTESLHGAGSPQAQRIQIARGMKIEDKKARARKLAGVKPAEK